VVTPVPVTLSPVARATQVSITFAPLAAGFAYGWLTPTELSPAIVYAQWIVTLEPSEVPLHVPAPQTVVHFETTESDPIGVDVPFQVPAIWASVIAGAVAGAVAGAATASLLAESTRGVSVFAQAATATTTGINFNTRRIMFSRLAAEKGEVWASLRWRL
jgi:hypothetical protein